MESAKSIYSPNSLQYLNTLSEFGFILAIRKKSRLAGDVLAEFEEGYADIPGTPDANYCTVLGKIGIEYQLIGQPEKGYSHLKQAVAIAGSFLSGAEFSQMPERDQLNFKVSAAWLYNNYFQMALESGASAREISDNALQWKGSILRLQSMKQGIDGSQKQQSDAAATFASITREIEQILPPKSVLVNFVEYSNLELVANGSPKDNLMLAVVVNADPNRDPKYFRLGMSKPIRECVEIWNAGMANERATFDEQAAARDAASQLRKLVWAPLQETVDDAELVMISTDGYLGRFPFAALPGSEEGHFLIEEYRLVNIAVPGLFLNRPEKNQTPPQVNLLAFGGINYDEPVGTDEKENGRPADPVLELSVPGFPYLDHSLSEVESVAACFPDGDTKVLSGNQARESKFKELAPVSAHLLLSTHAVFQWRAAVTSDNNAQPTPAQQILNDLDIRSGIAFAAANNSLEGLSVSVPPRFRDDGILYAHEIEKLDLRSVELAVLSACDSGNGAPTSGEGIIGLTRAFQISGARNTLATLWQVDDRATKKIMVKFFEVLREEKISPDAALRKAQLWAINNPREVVDIDTPRIARGAKNIGGREGKRNLSPYYWAPFVMSGNVDGLQVSDK